jgi:hypothetical protein
MRPLAAAGNRHDTCVASRLAKWASGASCDSFRAPSAGNEAEIEVGLSCRRQAPPPLGAEGIGTTMACTACLVPMFNELLFLPPRSIERGESYPSNRIADAVPANSRNRQNNVLHATSNKGKTRAQGIEGAFH